MNTPFFNKIADSELLYLDNASTSKLDERVFEEMKLYFLEYFGNASSNHEFGKISKKAINKARAQVSKLINCFEDEIIFTSGATESINLALKGFLEANPQNGNHIITAKTEHKAVLATCEYLETKGYDVTYLDVDINGLISLEELRNSVKENTSLVVIMYVNNETGVIQPIQEIGEFTRENNIKFFCDATQAVGKIEVDIEMDLIDMLCFSGHKLNGPKGIGVLYKRKDIEITPLIHGGGQEYGLRSGTYNTPLIVGLGKACEIGYGEVNKNIKKFKDLNNYLKESLGEIIPFKEISQGNLRVQNIINLIIPGLDSNIFMAKNNNLAVSNGSACNSELIEESHVIKAMLPKKSSENNYIRISFDKYSSKQDIDNLVETLKIYLNPNHA